MALPGLEDGSSHQDSHTDDRDPTPWAITCHLPEPASARSWAWRGGMPVPASALTARHERHHTWLDLSTVHHTGSLTLSSHEWCWFFWHMQPCLAPATACTSCHSSSPLGFRTELQRELEAHGQFAATVPPGALPEALASLGVVTSVWLACLWHQEDELWDKRKQATGSLGCLSPRGLWESDCQGHG